MKKCISILIAGLYSLTVYFGTLAMVPKTVLAEGEQNQATTQTEAPKLSNPVYKYQAQVNDNYSLMARKAVQTYGITNKVSLSQAKIIAAETWITQDAGSPELTVGQSVEISESAVKESVDKASKLSSEAEEAWSVYVVGVDFNTDSVGQSS